MNVLFVGPYRQKDGWGLASQSYIRAIASQTPNITTRPVFLAGGDGSNIDSDLLGYENSIYENYDIVIQKTLPHCLFYDRRFKKNIGLFVLETNNISNSTSIASINRMDEIWVPSHQEQKCLTKSGVTKPIKVISQPLDTSFISQHREHKLDFNHVLDKAFKFYFIGEYVERKNIKDLIIAFHLAFDISQPVALVLKTNIPGMSSNESHKTIEKDIDDIKKKLNISSRYKKEILVTEKLSYQDLIGLHNSCDCLVMPSYGEAFCRPAAEALCLGKIPIVTDNTGMIDFINSENGFVVQSSKTPVIVDKRTLSEDFDIYNAQEYWYKVQIYDLIDKMRAAYSLYKDNRKAFEAKRNVGLSQIEQFSYKNIGQKLCI
jgi:glycosyltransferase involved in cell wall biosynthesis